MSFLQNPVRRECLGSSTGWRLHQKSVSFSLTWILLKHKVSFLVYCRGSQVSPENLCEAQIPRSLPTYTEKFQGWKPEICGLTGLPHIFLLSIQAWEGQTHEGKISNRNKTSWKLCIWLPSNSGNQFSVRCLPFVQKDISCGMIIGAFNQEPW